MLVCIVKHVLARRRLWPWLIKSPLNCIALFVVVYRYFTDLENYKMMHLDKVEHLNLQFWKKYLKRSLNKRSGLVLFPGQMKMMTAVDVVKWLQRQAEWLLVGSVLALNHALADIVHVGRRQRAKLWWLHHVVRDRITTPNSTEVRPNSTMLPSRIIRPKFGKTELRPISTRLHCFFRCHISNRVHCTVDQQPFSSA